MTQTENTHSPKASASKVGVDLILQRVTSIGDITSQAAKVVLAVGVVVVFFYILHIRFIPSGVSLSDGIFFAFAALSGGMVISTVLLIGIFLTYWLLYLADYLSGRSGSKWRMRDSFKNILFLLFSIFSLLVFTYLIFISSPSIRILLLSIFAGGFILSIALLASPESKVFEGYFYNSPILANLLATVVASLIILILAFPPVIQATMRSIGVRQDAIFVALDKGNQKILKDTSIILGFSPIVCEMKNTDDYQMVKVDVLWGGVGARSLLAIHDKNSPDKPMRLEMDAAQVWPVRGSTECASSKVHVSTPTPRFPAASQP